MEKVRRILLFRSFTKVQNILSQLKYAFPTGQFRLMKSEKVSETNFLKTELVYH